MRGEFGGMMWNGGNWVGGRQGFAASGRHSDDSGQEGRWQESSRPEVMRDDEDEHWHRHSGSSDD